jgi:hypothetical protein
VQPVHGHERLNLSQPGRWAPDEETDMSEGSEVLIPLMGIVCAVGIPLSIPIVLAVLNYRKRRRLMELYHAERMAAIERGMELPPLPSEILGPAPTRHSTLLPGLIWLFVGLAILVALHAEGGNFLSGIGGRLIWGLVPTGIGLAYLIYYLIEGRKQVTPPQVAKAEP